MAGNSYAPVSDALLSLRQFSRNSQLINGIKWSSSLQNLTNVGQEVWKMWAESQ
jgi:hypothetical protein